MAFTLAIVGRPNVGKSTLFNRLIGKRLALVDDRPGVTRDRREGQAQLFGLEFKIVDTAGFEEANDASLEARMRQQTEKAIELADAVLFLTDARAGLLPLDEVFGSLLRKGERPVILAANKCEGRAAEAGVAELYALGLGEPLELSGEHGLGMSDLHARLLEIMEELGIEEDGSEEEREGDGPIQIAIVGRPNVGKSTLVNRILGEDRLLTGPEAGITRDSISLEWTYGGRRLKLVDTAGLRRRAKVTDHVERLSAADTKHSIDFAQVVVLLLDATQGMEKQDLSIGRDVIDEGRALILALNKWDACENRAMALRQIEDRLLRSFPQTKGIPIITLSALEGRGIDKLMKAVFRIYDVWNKRISTSKLNRWLGAVTEAHPPPAPGGRRIRLKYMTQARTRPPTFAISCNNPDDLPGSYLRYLENAIRDDFDMPGTPIRMHLKRSKNPYVSS